MSAPGLRNPTPTLGEVSQRLAYGERGRSRSVSLNSLGPRDAHNTLLICGCNNTREGGVMKNVKLIRRQLLHLAVGAIALTAASSMASAQTYPSRPITMVVPFAAGGAFDVIARVITPTLSEILHQQVIVENVGAAAGIVGTNRVAQAAPDGYSMLLGTVGTHAYNPALYKKLPYNPVSDFTPVGLVAEQPMVLIARKDFQPNTLPEFITYVKANSNKFQYGSAGVGSTTHLACALLNAATGINVTHVPYRGGGPAMADMIGGQIQYMCSNAPGAVPQIQGGSVKAIALLQRERSPLMPDLA